MSINSCWIRLEPEDYLVDGVYGFIKEDAEKALRDNVSLSSLRYWRLEGWGKDKSMRFCEREAHFRLITTTIKGNKLN